MATAPPIPQALDRAAIQKRVRHPLQRLRGYIRTYVSLEAAVLLGLYLVLWFWIGLALDYGAFLVAGWDWVQLLKWEFRAGLLGLLVAGLLAVLAFKALLRLFKEFRDPALALVLERRFPKELGDRLITAVELADPRMAKRYGYSQDMLDATVREAAEQVDQLPVKEVFHWKRLKRMGLSLAALIVGLYVSVGIGWYSYQAYTTEPEQRPEATSYVPRFNAVAATWFERNILLRNVIWPRTVYLELIGFPESGELKIGRDAPAPTIRARALRWVVADTRAPEGWRALTWTDVTPELLGEELPDEKFPAEWEGWTLDQVETYRLRDGRDQLRADTLLAVNQILERLEEQARSPWMSRRLRRLNIPGTVYIHYRSGSPPQQFKKQADNEFTITLGTLKDSIRFTVRAEDYSTFEKRITLVPPPNIAQGQFFRDELQPAYLYHRPPRDQAATYLRGKKHEFRNLGVSVAGTTSQIHVPVGTDLILRASTDKPLLPGVPQGVRIVQEGEAAEFPLRQIDEYTFEARFANVRTGLDFHFEFTDTDNVVGRRHVVIRPLEDRVPDMEVIVDGLPKRRGSGYLITPVARIPLSGKVRDDHGLEKVEWAHTVAGVDALAGLGTRALLSGLQFLPVNDPRGLAGATYLSWLGATFSNEGHRSSRTALESFALQVEQLAEKDVDVKEFQNLLTGKPAPRLVKEHMLEPLKFGNEFLVGRLGLKVKDEKLDQPHYRLQLWLVATDNNIEAREPGVSSSKEKFLFQVVSERELLDEIERDEGKLFGNLAKADSELREVKAKLDRVVDELPKLTPDEFRAMATRTEELIELVHKGSGSIREIHFDYLKILRELELNHVQPKNKVKEGKQERVEQRICNPLAVVLSESFPNTDKALRGLLKSLEAGQFDEPAAKSAQAEFDNLLKRLEEVLNAMSKLIEFDQLVKDGERIKKLQREGVSEALKRIADLEEKRLFDSLTGPKKN